MVRDALHLSNFQPAMFDTTAVGQQIPATSTESSVYSSTDCTELGEDLERELRGKIQYNNHDLLSELLGSAAEGHITQRSRPITGGVGPMAQEDRVKLIVASILENLPDELETLKTVANGARASLPPVEQERLMYGPLVRGHVSLGQ